MRKIRGGLVAEIVPVLTALGVDESAIFSENMARPEVSTDWIQLWFKPADVRVASLGTGGDDLAVGLMLVNIHSPLDDGNSFGLAAVSAMRIAFTAGKRIIFEGQEVEIIKCDANLGRLVDTWYRADIAIQWRAYLTRGAA
jgi:hypothetical protein